MAAQVAPTFSAFDDDDELLAQLPLDPTPGSTPAAAPRRVASQQQQPGGSQRAALARQVEALCCLVGLWRSRVTRN